MSSGPFGFGLLFVNGIGGNRAKSNEEMLSFHNPKGSNGLARKTPFGEWGRCRPNESWRRHPAARLSQGEPARSVGHVSYVLTSPSLANRRVRRAAGSTLQAPGT